MLICMLRWAPSWKVIDFPNWDVTAILAWKHFICLLVCLLFFNYGGQELFCFFHKKQSVRGNIHSLESFFSPPYVYNLRDEGSVSLNRLVFFFFWVKVTTKTESSDGWTTNRQTAHRCSSERFKGASKLDKSCCGGAGGERTKRERNKVIKT